MSNTWENRTRFVIDSQLANRQQTVQKIIDAGLDGEIDEGDALYVAGCYNRGNPVNFGGLREYATYRWMRQVGLAN